MRRGKEQLSGNYWLLLGNQFYLQWSLRTTKAPNNMVFFSIGTIVALPAVQTARVGISTIIRTETAM